MTITVFYKILFVVFSYLLGSVPTAYIIYKFRKGDDIRNYGSGNVGGTNVLRIAGPILGTVTIIVDIIKGFIPVMLIYFVFPASYILYVVATVAVLIGHVFPVFLRFKGGKGVSATGGLIIATCVMPFSGASLWLRILPAIVIVMTVLLVFFITRIMSLGSLSAAFILPIMFYACRYDLYIIIATIFWALITIIAHKDNIKRLIKGEEKKILRKRKEV
ncbi:MAG TPA: glycerol-3-phosphate 1-O-acyltransferase PlsY [Actinobacteria bacterium]|nr:glycerol-3-phosphate 1-O-acyltransferase PlsY [Actinomycetota bacterium]